MSDPSFIHLRLHSEYSIVDGIVRIEDVVAKAVADGMPALALTDLSNLFGLVKFYQGARTRGIKPIIGCDLWISNEADRVAVERVARRRRRNPAGPALEQRRAEARLELRDALARRRKRDAGALGAGGERAGVDHGDQQAQRHQIESGEIHGTASSGASLPPARALRALLKRGAI